jgi:hypothetical protein
MFVWQTPARKNNKVGSPSRQTSKQTQLTHPPHPTPPAKAIATYGRSSANMPPKKPISKSARKNVDGDDLSVFNAYVKLKPGDLSKEVSGELVPRLVPRRAHGALLRRRQDLRRRPHYVKLN